MKHQVIHISVTMPHDLSVRAIFKYRTSKSDSKIKKWYLAFFATKSSPSILHFYYYIMREKYVKFYIIFAGSNDILCVHVKNILALRVTNFLFLPM